MILLRLNFEAMDAIAPRSANPLPLKGLRLAHRFTIPEEAFGDLNIPLICWLLKAYIFFSDQSYRREVGSTTPQGATIGYNL
jgi:hypothetical protein